MLRLMVVLILFFLLTACQPALLPPEVVTASPIDIPRAAEMPTLVATATETPLPTNTPTPIVTIDPFEVTITVAAATRAALSKIEPEVTQLNGLAISETALLPAEQYRLIPEDIQNNEVLHFLLPQEMLELHWHEDFLYPEDPKGEKAQAVVSQFGYRLEQVDDIYWRLLQGETLLADTIRLGYGPLFHQVNQSGTDFWMVLSVNDIQFWLLRKGGFELWYEGKPHPNPIFVGDDFYTAQVATKDGEDAVLVKRNGEVVYFYAGPELKGQADTCPIETFRAWEDTWVLQIDDQVIVDGRSLRDAGYARSFGWQTLGGKPYFLFQKGEGGLYGVSYDGQDLPLQYEEIVYWSCIMSLPSAPCNPDGSEEMATFFARNEGMWHYVEIVPE